ncbi:Pep3/Vps18/deep orange family-domain-containing protein [Gorgonomyces haynaldii]|nr:Pep3/Vps18/deep orange family-domain-containing protein [Gorgonomyces haynaldii]
MIPYPRTNPISFTMTQFYLIYLFSDELVMVNRLDTSLVSFMKLTLDVHEKPVVLVSDAQKNTHWLATNQNLYEILLKDELEDIWRIYLQKQDYTNALQYCPETERHQIYEKQAKEAFKQKRYQEAADFYALTNQSLEQVVLQFTQLNLKRPLMQYLTKRLEQQTETTQRILLSTWLLELKLSLEELDLQFFERMKPYFHQPTVYRLLEEHGNLNLILQYAQVQKDWNRVFDIYMDQNKASLVLELISNLNSTDLIYKYSFWLLQTSPKETIQLWKRFYNLQVRLLLPCILKYEAQKLDMTPVCDYLMFVIQELKNQDTIVHNYLFYLLAEQKREDQLLLLIKNSLYIDCKYCLRICTHHQLFEPSIQLYLLLELPEEALQLSLQKQDLETAKSIAYRQEDEDTLRQLWLTIVKHCIESNQSIPNVIELAKEGDLKIEDILPLFPDFVLIDDIKQDLISALMEHNEKLERLKKQLDESANGAADIRTDIRELKKRYVTVSVTRHCDLCRKHLLTSQFFVFPCGHGFHQDCLATELSKDSIKAIKIRESDQVTRFRIGGSGFGRRVSVLQ